MSFNNEEIGTPFILVRGGKSDGEIIYVSKGNEEDKGKKSVIKKDALKSLHCEKGKFFQIPNNEVRVVYITGPSGSGKSTKVKDYASMYNKLYPEATIYLFSRLDHDTSLEGLPVRRIHLSEDLVTNPLEIEEVKENSMVIFDDCDAISNKKLSDSIYQFQIQLLELGRHMNIQVVMTSHLIIGAKSQAQARTILNEMQSLTVFPGSGSASQISYVLGKYFGMTKKQITKLLAMDSRSVTIIKTYPQFVIAEHEAIFVSQL